MKATVFLLCFVLFLGVVVGYCPNDCSSPNGVCSAAQVCQCEEGLLLLVVVVVGVLLYWELDCCLLVICLLYVVSYFVMI